MIVLFVMKITAMTIIHLHNLFYYLVVTLYLADEVFQLCLLLNRREYCVNYYAFKLEHDTELYITKMPFMFDPCCT